MVRCMRIIARSSALPVAALHMPEIWLARPLSPSYWSSPMRSDVSTGTPEPP